MEIIKNNIKYNVAEHATRWVLTKTIDKVSISYSLSKKDFESIAAVKVYVSENDMF